MEVLDALMYFGLTRHEATLYTALLAEGNLTGYEAAKLSGISRSNTYNALAGLADKGAAYVTEDTATRYLPVAAEEFCANKIRRMDEYKTFLTNILPTAKSEAEGYITIKGAQAIWNKLRNLITRAEARIYVSGSRQLVEALRKELTAAIERSLKVVVITEEPFKLSGAIIHYTEKQDTQIRLIADSSRVLTGDLAEGKTATCLYSGKRNLVDLFKDAMKNEIKLIELLSVR